MALVEVKVPDIGDFKDVEVIELLVKPGDTVKAEQSLITVESDKASMEIPSSHAGVVKELKVKLGDKVGEGSAAAAARGRCAAAAAPAAPAAPRRARAHRSLRRRRPQPAAAAASGGPVDVVVPDIGDFDEVAVIEVLVKPGDTVKVEQSLITVESDKASMEIPSSHAGVVKELQGQARRQGGQGQRWSPCCEAVGRGCGAGTRLRRRCAGAPAAPPAVAAGRRGRAPTAARAGARADGAAAARCRMPRRRSAVRARTRRAAGRGQGQRAQGPHHAGRRAGLRQGRDGRRAQTAAQKAAAPAAAAGGGAFPGLLPWPQVDFAKFGPVERKDLSRIKKISGANLHRNWVVIPHVTNHDDADITELEAFRVQLNKENEKSGVKVTMLAFLIKAAVAALKKFPEFNASARRRRSWCSRSTSTSASPPTRPTAWWCR